MNYNKHYSAKETPQTQAIPGREADMAKNNAGGVTFTVDMWKRLDRFLILGSEGGTYYVSENKLSVDNSKNIITCIKEDGVRTVERIVEISVQGRAPKNDTAIFALGLCCAYGDEKTKKAAHKAITQVCRIGTHLFQFLETVENHAKWGRGLRNGVSDFYTKPTVDKVMYQLIKYRQRNGWTHRDAMRLAHPSTKDKVRNDIFRWTVGKPVETLPEYIQNFEKLQNSTNDKEAVSLITQNRFPWEAVPTELLNSVKVWEALLETMPLNAMVRNLGKMTSMGLLKTGLDDSVKKVVDSLLDVNIVKKSRIHPMQLFMAYATYKSGHGFRGSLSWSPVQRILDALMDAFYMSFDNVEPTNQNWLLSLDVSGSMCATLNNSHISAREASAVMAMVTARTEQNHAFMAFSSGFIPLNISPKMSFEQVLKVVSGLRFDSTDCSLPMVYAIQNKIKVDTFVVYTDSETYAGRVQPVQALNQYRKEFNPNAKLIVVGMTSNGFTIADPNDSGMLDVVGFDSSTPQIMADFSRGF